MGRRCPSPDAYDLHHSPGAARPIGPSKAAGRGTLPAFQLITTQQAQQPVSGQPTRGLRPPPPCIADSRGDHQGPAAAFGSSRGAAAHLVAQEAPCSGEGPTRQQVLQSSSALDAAVRSSNLSSPGLAATSSASQERCVLSASIWSLPVPK
ncbi:hypothetical protein NDU88_006573 [Pleurodeles waltl]|uniref:Uncharacterized protein n=1 Tax=Pleurodeles waltl TaxID=8319 RepID=A0AAV7QM55_PLEWA|nr:hypothetical protein NDU88_006573 [Pleurodeles waltl]